MGLLARKNQDDERGGDSLALSLDDLVCPTCGRDLPPWVEVCPDDQTPAVPREQTQNSRLPDIPAHLLEGLDDERGDGEATASLDGADPRPGDDDRV